MISLTEFNIRSGSSHTLRFKLINSAIKFHLTPNSSERVLDSSSQGQDTLGILNRLPLTHNQLIAPRLIVWKTRKNRRDIRQIDCSEGLLYDGGPVAKDLACRSWLWLGCVWRCNHRRRVWNIIGIKDTCSRRRNRYGRGRYSRVREVGWLQLLGLRRRVIVQEWRYLRGESCCEYWGGGLGGLRDAKFWMLIYLRMNQVCMYTKTELDESRRALCKRESSLTWERWLPPTDRDAIEDF